MFVYLSHNFANQVYGDICVSFQECVVSPDILMLNMPLHVWPHITVLWMLSSREPTKCKRAKRQWMIKHFYPLLLSLQFWIWFPTLKCYHTLVMIAMPIAVIQQKFKIVTDILHTCLPCFAATGKGCSKCIDPWEGHGSQFQNPADFMRCFMACSSCSSLSFPELPLSSCFPKFCAAPLINTDNKPTLLAVLHGDIRQLNRKKMKWM